jgi:hypothetical protein
VLAVAEGNQCQDGPDFQVANRAEPRSATPGARCTLRPSLSLYGRPGDRVHWRGYVGSFLRDVDEAEAAVLIGTRTYRVRRADLQPV